MPQDSEARTATFLPLTPGKSGKVFGHTKSDGACDWAVILDDTVIFPDPYLELVHTIMNMRESDTLTIYLCTNGGWVESGIDLIHAIQNSKGTVVTHAIGMCASIGAVIWCCGKIRKISPLATLMFHMPSGGYFGKSLDVRDETNYLCDYFYKLLHQITAGILTEENLVDITQHRKDVYVDGITVNDRLKNLAEATHEA